MFKALPPAKCFTWPHNVSHDQSPMVLGNRGTKSHHRSVERPYITTGLTTSCMTLRVVLHSFKTGFTVIIIIRLSNALRQVVRLVLRRSKDQLHDYCRANQE